MKEKSFVIETCGQASEILKNLKKKIGNQKGSYLIIDKKLFNEIKKRKPTGFKE